MCACASIACRRPEAVEPPQQQDCACPSLRQGWEEPTVFLLYGCIWVESSTDGPIEIHFTNLIPCVCRQHIREQRTAGRKAVELARYAAERNPARQDGDGHKISPPSQSTRRLPAARSPTNALRDDATDLSRTHLNLPPVMVKLGLGVGTREGHCRASMASPI